MMFKSDSWKQIMQMNVGRVDENKAENAYYLNKEYIQGQEYDASIFHHLSYVKINWSGL